jgi:uncharacterized protein (TIGR02646 family)
MKQIIKTAEPQSLVRHRAKQHSNFDNIPFDTKLELKESLLSEQGYICCYCMRRIPENIYPYMKVEHYKCQDFHEDLQLNYKNLLGACIGNEGQPNRIQTCDSKKGNKELTINLLTNTPRCETLFKYNAEGEIMSIDDNSEVNRQLTEVLNLNMQSLKDGRREVYLEVQKNVEAQSRQLGTKQLRVNYFEHEKQNWLTPKDKKLKQFCMVAVYYLNKKIKQNQN